MTRRPPLPTPFPYTTLFRSGEQEVTTAAEAADAARDAELDLLRRRTLVSAVLSVPVILLAMVPPLQFTYWQWLSLTLAAPVVVWGDRKSTRLNSSHVAISYAVFCLKKNRLSM